MKLIIQIPCYNEEATLSDVIKDLPKELDGIEQIEYLVIDDGSSDNTVQIAKKLGVHHILELGSNHGLAKAFTRGINYCLNHGADIIVNTDGDNQYKADCIKNLIKPIIDNQADIVVGARPIEQIEHFSFIKKKLQRLGSSVVRRFSGTNVPDTTSGFRAYSAQAASQLQVFNRYTYTLETIIQAGAMDMRITSVPIDVNDKMRESRLFKSVAGYIWRSVCVILRSYIIYKPFMTF
ncbi:MAG: glycosyltransferase family 2 protein [Phycisphaerae bacterium]|nr:glycosyltransferase family 2 protein [Phycisphaerae bacterium]